MNCEIEPSFIENVALREAVDLKGIHNGECSVYNAQFGHEGDGGVELEDEVHDDLGEDEQGGDDDF